MLYVALRQVLDPQPANYLAWGLTAIVDIAANRHLTFEAAERVGRVGPRSRACSSSASASSSPASRSAPSPQRHLPPGEWLELAVLGGANLLAGIVRFELLRRWVFAPERARAAQA